MGDQVERPEVAAHLAKELSFESIFRDELVEIVSDCKPPEFKSCRELYEWLDKRERPLAALCLSGGGIRSASFALGVLQGLARFGVLDKFDYLSTVSGGGYIGSWLSAWRLHAKAIMAKTKAIVPESLDRTKNRSGEEAAEIRGLRADSNYLTPKLGLLSADTWAVVALIIRNLVLNWLIFFPFFMGVLFVPWLCFDFLRA